MGFEEDGELFVLLLSQGWGPLLEFRSIESLDTCVHLFEVFLEELAVDDLDVTQRIDVAFNVNYMFVFKYANNLVDHLNSGNIVKKGITKAATYTGTKRMSIMRGDHPFPENDSQFSVQISPDKHRSVKNESYNLTFARAFDKTGDIDNTDDGRRVLRRFVHIQQVSIAVVCDGNGGHVGIDGAERVVLSRNTHSGKEVEERGFSDVGETDETDFDMTSVEWMG